jgi:hypothetical protein
MVQVEALEGFQGFVHSADAHLGSSNRWASAVVEQGDLSHINGALVSCPLDGTFVDMWDAIRSGDWATFGMCVLSFVPGGKSAKLGLKAALGKADDIAKIIKEGGGATADNFRKRLVAATGENPKAMDAHHTLPKCKADLIENKVPGVNVHDTKWGAWWDSAANQGRNAQYNARVDDFLNSGTVNSEGDLEGMVRMLSGEFGFKWPP